MGSIQFKLYGAQTTTHKCAVQGTKAEGVIEVLSCFEQEAEFPVGFIDGTRLLLMKIQLGIEKYTQVLDALQPLQDVRSKRVVKGEQLTASLTMERNGVAFGSAEFQTIVSAPPGKFLYP